MWWFRDLALIHGGAALHQEASLRTCRCGAFGGVVALWRVRYLALKAASYLTSDAILEYRKQVGDVEPSDPACATRGARQSESVLGSAPTDPRPKPSP